MIHLRTLLAIGLLFTRVQAGPDERPDAKAVLDKLSARRLLADYVSQWRSRHEQVPAGHSKIPQLKSDAEIETALKAAETAVQQLRKLIRPGTSVFAYPGLLARGDLRFDPAPVPSYILHIGIPPGWNWDHEQGVNENEYEIVFDERGIITELRPIVYRH